MDKVVMLGRFGAVAAEVVDDLCSRAGVLAAEPHAPDTDCCCFCCKPRRNWLGEGAAAVAVPPGSASPVTTEGLV
jgi:hypothetical protein